VEAVSSFRPRPKILAVTVLTSLDAADLAAMGVSGSPAGQVVRLRKISRKISGIDGVVCQSAGNRGGARGLRPDFLIVTPGVRPAGGSLDDQRRVMTPKRALEAGRRLLVIGRPITGAPDPAEAAKSILAELRA